MPALVSVGLPTYNRARSLDRAIRSVLAQTHEDLELVVCDNASTDETPEVCRAWADRDPRVRYVRHPQNIGMVGNFNAVIAELRGDFALLCADDDWLDEDYVQRCLEVLQQHPDHALVAGRSRLYEGDEAVTLGQPVDLQDERPDARVRHFLRTVTDNSVFYGLTRTSALRDAAPMHEVLGGDWLLVAGIAFRGKVRTLSSTHVNRAKGGTSSSVRSVLATFGITRGPRWRFPWAAAVAVCLVDMAWRSPAYARLSQPRRTLFALRAAPSAMRWKGTLWQLMAPSVLSISRRRRGRWLWKVFETVGARLGDLPLHEIEPGSAPSRATLPRVAATETTDLRARVAEVPVWWHSIDLGGGVVTPGNKSLAVLEREIETLHLGDLRGKSVLDIGAWDGAFSFAAERAGAERVVALDHWTWSMDLAGYDAYRLRSLDEKVAVIPPNEHPDYWHPDTLPGKRGIDIAIEALGSKVETVVGDVLDPEFDLDALGQFDLVLYLGVLYHVKHPLLALERLARLTRGALIVETQAETFRGLENKAICRFFEGSELNGDPSNWWVYNTKALVDLCRAAGFGTVEVLAGPSKARRAYAAAVGSAPFRATVRAAK